MCEKKLNMKKITLFIALFISLVTYAQTPIITMISDGDCSGGNPKVVEIYANGTVDFSQYNIEIQTNANTNWVNPLNLADFGIVTDDFIYIYRGEEAFSSEYSSAVNALSTTSSAVNFNGDDRVRIVEATSGNVIDQYGVDSLDGTGEVWEYQDGYAKRNNGSGPDAAFIPTNWTYFNGALDGEGTCQGGTAFEDIIGIGSYESTGGSTDPVLLITSPANNFVFNPGTTSVSISFSGQNLPDGSSFDIDVNGNLTSNISSPFDIQTVDGESYTIEISVLDGQTVVTSDSRSFSIAEIIQVTNISDLRADVAENGLGGYYEITGASIFIHGDNFNNRKWFQDNNGAGIQLFDSQDIYDNGIYNVGDNVVGLKGVTSVFNGVLQLSPLDNSAAVNGNTEPNVSVISMQEYTENFQSYESTLIGIENVTYAAGDGQAVFANGQNYVIESGELSVVHRTDFFNVDYIGTTIPQGMIQGVRGIANSFNGTPQILARNAADIDVTLNTIQFDRNEFSIYPNPATGVVNLVAPSGEQFSVEVYNVLGRRVLSTELNGAKQINVHSFQSGVYLVKFVQGNKNYTRKLIIK